jgi:hypothetical protein
MLAVAGLFGLALIVSPGPWFVDVTGQSGIPSLRHGEGVNAVDIDCDDTIDLYLPCVRDEGRLLKNLGNGRFEDVTTVVGLSEKGGVGAAVGDLNGDARPDIYIARGADPYVAPNLIYMQQSDGSFRNASSAVGVSEYSSGLSVVMADFNGDGHRDAFLPGWGRDLFFTNNKLGRLAETSHASGLTHAGRGWSALASDFNGDGNLDIFATYGSYAEPHDNRLYLNRGDGTFTEETESAGLTSSPWSLGSVSADFDNDGDFDLYVTGYGGPGKLYRNEGRARFTDVTRESGLTAVKCVGVTSGQIDGDLLPDIVVGGFAGPAKVYKNLGHMKFAEVANAGLKDFNRNEGLTLADLDNDGDLDLYVSNVEGHNRLYQNRLDDKRFLKVIFDCSPSALEGAVARLSRKNSLLAVQELAGAVGMGQGPQGFLFRLPDDDPFDLEVIMPDGRIIHRRKLTPGVLKLQP